MADVGAASWRLGPPSKPAGVSLVEGPSHLATTINATPLPIRLVGAFRQQPVNTEDQRDLLDRRPTDANVAAARLNRAGNAGAFSD